MISQCIKTWKKFEEASIPGDDHDGLADVAVILGQKHKADDVYENTHIKRVASTEIDTDIEGEDESPVSQA